jgi:hypothetical protein
MESIIGLLMARGRKIDRIRGYAEREVEEHQAILDLLRARDGVAIEAAMRAHIIGSAQTYDTGDPVDGVAEPAAAGGERGPSFSPLQANRSTR